MLCQFCTQLARSFPLKTNAAATNTIECPTCTIAPHTNDTHTPCSSCIAFALLTQNSYANRWDAILNQPTLIHSTPVDHMSQPPQLSPINTNQSHPRLQASPPPLTPVLPSTPSSTTTLPQPQIALPQQVTTTTHTILQAFLRKPNHQQIHFPHPLLPLTYTHMHRLALKFQHPNVKSLNEAVIFHYMSAIGHQSNCQPNRRLFLYINQQTHVITPHSYQHKTEYVIINVHTTPTNPHVIYKRISPDTDTTTTLIHLAPTPPPVHKRKRRPRATNSLPTATRIETTLMTAAHLVLTELHIKRFPWNILRHVDFTPHTLYRVMATLCLHKTYPIWTSPSTTPTATPCYALRASPATHSPASTSIDIHLTPPSKW